VIETFWRTREDPPIWSTTWAVGLTVGMAPNRLICVAWQDLRQRSQKSERYLNACLCADPQVHS
jgi:hypothetical protein